MGLDALLRSLGAGSTSFNAGLLHENQSLEAGQGNLDATEATIKAFSDFLARMRQTTGDTETDDASDPSQLLMRVLMAFLGFGLAGGRDAEALGGEAAAVGAGQTGSSGGSGGATATGATGSGSAGGSGGGDGGSGGEILRQATTTAQDAPHGWEDDPEAALGYTPAGVQVDTRFGTPWWYGDSVQNASADLTRWGYTPPGEMAPAVALYSGDVAEGYRPGYGNYTVPANEAMFPEITDMAAYREDLAAAFPDAPAAWVEYVIEQGEVFDIDPAFVLATIQQESNFNSEAVGDGGVSMGLGQINQGFFEAGENWQDPLTNIHEIFEVYSDIRSNHTGSEPEAMRGAYVAGVGNADWARINHPGDGLQRSDQVVGIRNRFFGNLYTPAYETAMARQGGSQPAGSENASAGSQQTQPEAETPVASAPRAPGGSSEGQTQAVAAHRPPSPPAPPVAAHQTESRPEPPNPIRLALTA